MNPARCVCGHDTVLHELLGSGVRAGRCAQRLCVCGADPAPLGIVTEVRQLLARVADWFRRPARPVRAAAALPPLVESPASDVELERLFRDANHHARHRRNQQPARYRRVPGQRNAAPRR